MGAPVTVFWAACALLVIVVVFLIHADARRDARGLSILEVDGPEGLVPEVLRKRSPVVVVARGAEGIARRLRLFPRVVRHALPAGAVRLVACDYAVVTGAAEVGLVHPAHRPVLRAKPERGGAREVEGFGAARCGYVAVRLPPDGCLVVPRNWAVALDFDACEMQCVNGPLPKWM
jgi:hypothetical protein